MLPKKKRKLIFPITSSPTYNTTSFIFKYKHFVHGNVNTNDSPDQHDHDLYIPLGKST